ncbi:uncharacterized protein BJX67DRAFT_384748 [Aspergillus lucknowensis]|uniref:FR47-like domain-containing protein n=1 Tax=Aspergillus lucknowensis TaxID=176173 RepID=A0ABR4LFZ3_9EURO
MHAHKHPYTPLLSALHSHLPFSGPLYRRIQFQVTHKSPTAHVLATFPESGPSPSPSTQEPWLAVYTDIHAGTDTQVWIFSSLETKGRGRGRVRVCDLDSIKTGDGDASTPLTPQEREITKAQLLTLFRYIRATLIPPYVAWLSTRPGHPQMQNQNLVNQGPGQGLGLEDGGGGGGVKKLPAHVPTSFLMGTVHAALVELIVQLRDEGALRIHRGQDTFYAKYCFPLSAFPPRDPGERDRDQRGGERPNADADSMGGYRFHSSAGVSGIQACHIDLVNSRTNVNRSREALMAMGGVALYHSHSRPCPLREEGQGSRTGLEMPIGWAFLGFDGSLCTLHVEPQHRGKGLAGVLGREVMKRGVGVFEPRGGQPDTEGRGGEEWFYADVAVGNAASRRVMEKMGGVVGWTTAWLVVEVDL